MSFNVDVGKKATSESLLSVFNNPNFSGFKNTYGDVSESISKDISTKEPGSLIPISPIPAKQMNSLKRERDLPLSPEIDNTQNIQDSSLSISADPIFDSLANNEPKDSENSLSTKDLDAHKLIMMLKGFEKFHPNNQKNNNSGILENIQNTSTNDSDPSLLAQSPQNFLNSPSSKSLKFSNPIDPFNLISETMNVKSMSQPITSPQDNPLDKHAISSLSQDPPLPISDVKTNTEIKKVKKKRSKKVFHVPYGDPMIQSNFHSIVQIALVSTLPDESLKRAIGANGNYICYGKKGGDIRIIQQWTEQRDLLVGHTVDVSQIKFHPVSKLYPDNLSILATVGCDNSVIIWNLDTNCSPKLFQNSSEPAPGSSEIFESKLIDRFFINSSEKILSVEWCPEYYNLKPENFDFATLAIATDKNLYILTIPTCPGPSSNLVVNTFSSSIISNSSISSIVWVKRKFGWDLLVASEDGSLRRLFRNSSSDFSSLEFQLISSTLGSHIILMKWVSPFTLTEGLGHLLIARSNSFFVDLRWLGPDSDVLGGNVSNVICRLDLSPSSTSAVKKIQTPGDSDVQPSLEKSFKLGYEDISHTLIVTSKLSTSMVFIPIIPDTSQPSYVCFDVSVPSTLLNREKITNNHDSPPRRIAEISKYMSSSVFEFDSTLEECGDDQTIIGLYCVFSDEISQYQLLITPPPSCPLRLQNYNELENDVSSSLQDLMIYNDLKIKETISQQVEDQNSDSRLNGAEYLEWMLSQAASLRPRALSTNHGTVDTSDIEDLSSTTGRNNYPAPQFLGRDLFNNKSPSFTEDFKSVTSTNVQPAYTPKIAESKDGDSIQYNDIEKSIKQLNIAIEEEESKAQQSFSQSLADQKKKEFNSNRISDHQSIDGNQNFLISEMARNSLGNLDYPIIDKLIKESVKDSLTEIILSEEYKSLISSIVQETLTQAINSSLLNSLQNSVESAMKSSLIPAYNRATDEMFKQINSSFSSGVQQLINSANNKIVGVEPKTIVPSNHFTNINNNTNFNPSGNVSQKPLSPGLNDALNNKNISTISNIGNSYTLPIENHRASSFSDSQNPSQFSGNVDFVSNQQHADSYQNQQQISIGQNNNAGIMLNPNQTGMFQFQNQMGSYPNNVQQNIIPGHPHVNPNTLAHLSFNKNLPNSQTNYIHQLQQIQGQLGLNPATNPTYQPSMFNSGVPNVGPISQLVNSNLNQKSQLQGQNSHNPNAVTENPDNRINSLVALLNSGGTSNLDSTSPREHKKKRETLKSKNNMQIDSLNRNITNLVTNSQLSGSSEPKSPCNFQAFEKENNENGGDSLNQSRRNSRVFSETNSHRTRKNTLSSGPRPSSGSHSPDFDLNNNNNVLSVADSSREKSTSEVGARSSKVDLISPGHPTEDLALSEINKMIELKRDPRDILTLALSTKLSGSNISRGKGSNPLHIVYKVISIIKPDDLEITLSEVDIEFLFSLIYSLVINPDLASANVDIMEKWLYMLLSKLRKRCPDLSSVYGWSNLDSSSDDIWERELRSSLSSLSSANAYLVNETGHNSGKEVLKNNEILSVKAAVLRCLETTSMIMGDCESDNDVRLLAKIRTLIRLVQNL
ncbi:hypothetical protein AYI68_g2625 [Smittium mucronatum]|uniref:Uncharacterized protein n=1 Tax=Smittium mucronatum TaxID=133383 RepID=A0A1R0H261_9FUNG|nr:hypothetical protein AYI68_g2625 [Smittium mucronatum]